MMKKDESLELHETGSLLLDVGSLLMSSGATTSRVRNTVHRISDAFGYKINMLITNRAITLSITDKEEQHFFNSLKRTSPHGINFKVVSGISRMSWRVVQEKWTCDQIRTELDRLVSLPPYQAHRFAGCLEAVPWKWRSLFWLHSSDCSYGRKP
jgi:uncharacterized membrane protein YjjP (DUF1212 family)